MVFGTRLKDNAKRLAGRFVQVENSWRYYTVFDFVLPGIGQGTLDQPTAPGTWGVCH